MSKVQTRPYISSGMVLLAFDWSDGSSRNDFLGFAISRSPGFGVNEKSWLPNRIGFQGPAPDGGDLPSNTNPIQKFMWWDARINDTDRGKQFNYIVTPVVGTTNNMQMLVDSAETVTVTIPFRVEQGIGTYFNRAVVSSQAFVKEFGTNPSGDALTNALAWLANGLHTVVPEFLTDSQRIEGAIYHLTDSYWIIPALENFQGKASIVYNSTKKDQTNDDAVNKLQGKITFSPRTHANIMHDKFLVKLQDDHPSAVLMGSANFTTEGIATQANLLHTFESAELSALYLARERLLQTDPTIPKISRQAGWSDPIQAGDAKIRAFFPPEPADHRDSIDAIVQTVSQAQSSVIFCLFDPTDQELLPTMFKAGDQGKMMFGLVNSIAEQPPKAAEKDKVEIYHRSHEKNDVYPHTLYPKGGQPAGFWWEVASLSDMGSKFPVYIHHKFVVIDAETANPTIYTGSANLSSNSTHRNDENLLEIKNCPRLSAIYLAEFLRLYEHYRARAMWNRYMEGKVDTYRLQPDARWATRAYQPGTPESKSRQNMVKAL